MQPLERPEETRCVGLLKACAVIADEICLAAIDSLRAEFNLSLFSFRGEFPRISDQIL